MNSTGEVTPESIAAFSKDFAADRANRVAANAATSAGVLTAATSYAGARALPRDFSIELTQGSITNQRRSGRCWMFASLNTLRYELMHRWNLDDFEFSEAYLFFWDKVEKANVYLENVLATLAEPTDSRVFQAINEGPVDDGGWWQMFTNLASKYGLVPASAYPENANTKDSDAFVQYLNTMLRDFAATMRTRHAAGIGIDELRAYKAECMKTVYRVTAISLGEPPRSFEFLARTKDDAKDEAKDETKGDGKSDAKSDARDAGKDAEKDADTAAPKDGTANYNGTDSHQQIHEASITPLEFLHKYVPVQLDDFVTLCNAPMERTLYWKRYAIDWTTNVAGTEQMTFVNVPMKTLRDAAVRQLQAGHPLWFACDCMQYALRGAGVFDPATVRVDELFGVDMHYDKAQAIEYRDAESNHAMTLTGVNLDANGVPNRWKIENSWGKDSGKDGYFVASAEWFDRYVTELVVRKEYLDDATRAALTTEPVHIAPWQPLTRRCR
ncbi:MAG: C1 family peptidase [Bifidobacteriaceae bacterium]|nr:C1 family peptidase [Bifidobacteriaceae bacterium]